MDFCLCWRFLCDCDDVKCFTDWCSSAAHTSFILRDLCPLLVSDIMHGPSLLSDFSWFQWDFNVLLYMFRYWFPAGSSNSLSVHLLWGDELTDALWHRSGTPSSDWEVAEVTMSSPVKFYVSHFNHSHNQIFFINSVIQINTLFLHHSREAAS